MPRRPRREGGFTSLLRLFGTTLLRLTGCKLISYADSREQALVRMQIALDELLIDGIRSNTSLHRDLVRDSEFQKGGVNIHYLEQKLES